MSMKQSNVFISNVTPSPAATAGRAALTLMTIILLHWRGTKQKVEYGILMKHFFIALRFY